MTAYIQAKFVYSVHSSYICDWQKLEIIYVSISTWMDKQMVVYPYNGMVLNNEEEWTLDSYNNMYASQNNYAV